MAGFSMEFVVRAAALMGIDLWRQYYRQIDAAMLAVAFGCMVFWVVTLRPEGRIGCWQDMAGTGRKQSSCSGN